MTPRRATMPGNDYSTIAGLGRSVVRVEEGLRHLGEKVEAGDRRAAEGRAELQETIDRRCDQTDEKVDGLTVMVRELLDRDLRRRGVWAFLRGLWNKTTVIAGLVLTALGILAGIFFR